ncbi:MAG TPA: response regulator transcription factor [Flavobacterium sp.]|jgi:DNA-binding response OmpR family regulator
MARTRIILAEDEPALALIIKESLETRNFDVTVCKNGAEASAEFYRRACHLLVLDIMMPIKDGLTLAREIRKTDKKIPIIFLTAKSQTQDVLEGFHAGAQDYIKKPFSMQELIVRIDSLLGRNQADKQDTEIHLGCYVFNPVRQTLELSGTIATLTHRESSLLQLLIENRNEVLDRSVILKKIWGDDDFFNGRSMDVFITKLRKKLGSDPRIQILNVRGLGYKMITD